MFDKIEELLLSCGVLVRSDRDGESCLALHEMFRLSLNRALHGDRSVCTLDACIIMLISAAEPTTSPAESDPAVSQHTIEKYASNAWEVMVLVCVPVLRDLPAEHVDPSSHGVQLPLTGH